MEDANSKIGKISSLVEREYILSSIKQKNVELNITSKEKICFSGSLLHYDKTTLTIKHNCNLSFSLFQKIKVSFFLKNSRHLFETTIKTIIDPHTFILKQPREIWRNPQRRFERITLEHITQISIKYKGKTTVLNFPETEHFIPFSMEKFQTRQLSSIQNLLSAFKQKMEIFSKNLIVMLRDKQPRTLEEFLITKTGKAFFIPNTFRYFPDSQVYDATKIITSEDLIEYEKLMGTDEHLIQDKITQTLVEKQKKEIFSELYFPIIYRKFVISYIYLMNTIEKKAQIAYNTIQKLDEFGKLLIATLIKHGYFDKMELRQHETNLIDISAGGLLFSSTDPDLWKVLETDDIIDISFVLKGNFFDLKGLIRRKFQENEILCFGVQFIEYHLDTQNLLQQLLYDK